MKRRTRFLLCGVGLSLLLVLVGVWALRGEKTDQPWVELRCGGPPSLTNVWAELALTNRSSVRLTCHPRTQMLTPRGWLPTPGGPPDFTARMFTLLPKEGCVFEHRVPPTTNQWRVLVNCYRPVTPWERRRRAWSGFCASHHLRWLGDWMMPRLESEWVVSKEFPPVR